MGSCGYISTRNQSAIYTLHKFTKPGSKLSKFKKNISSLALYSSYQIFITRNEEHFNQPSFLLPPFESENWINMKIYVQLIMYRVFWEDFNTMYRWEDTPRARSHDVCVWNHCQKNLCVITGYSTLSWVTSIIFIVLARYLGACDYNFFVFSKFDK